MIKTQNPAVRDAAKARFFQGMSFAASTVNVVTTDGQAGRAGVTVSAMSSVSADAPKPTLLVCINESSSATDAILENGVFCVNVLRDHQDYISDAFAGRYKDTLEDKFGCTEWETGVTGAPRVADALVAFDCRLSATKKVGTHYVCFGEVEDIHIGRQGSALVYANRAYGASMRIDTASNTDFARRDLDGVLRVGCFHTFGPFILPRLMAALKAEAPNVRCQLVEGDERRMKGALLSGEIDVAILYDFENDPALKVDHLTDLEPYVLLNADHPLAGHATLTPAQLHGQDMISVNEASSREKLEGLLTEAGAKPNVVFRTSSFEMVRGMVGHGFGFAVLMTKPASATTYDGMSVVSRPLKTSAPPGRVVFAVRADEAETALLSGFRGTALRVFRG